jgi:DNA-binding HxlR family transcriptional regulator
LSLLSAPLNVLILRALEQEPMPLPDLRLAVGSPPQTTMRNYLKSLEQGGIVERHAEEGFPGAVEYELARPGRALTNVAAVLQKWLDSSPHGPLTLGSGAAKNAIKALVDGWSTALVRALAARPLSLTELSRLIPGINYPSLERRLREMRVAGLINACAGEGRRTPYRLAIWLRQATAPLTAAAEWERRFDPESSAALARLDVEAAFLLSVPVLRLQEEHSGLCRLAVELSPSQDPAGVIVTVEAGRIVQCASRQGGRADGWVVGSPSSWTSSLLRGDVSGLEIGGDYGLGRALIDRLHADLFAVSESKGSMEDRIPSL